MKTNALYEKVCPICLCKFDTELELVDHQLSAHRCYLEGIQVRDLLRKKRQLKSKPKKNTLIKALSQKRLLKSEKSKSSKSPQKAPSTPPPSAQGANEKCSRKDPKETIHTKSKRWRCKWCGATFKCDKEAMAHVKQMHYDKVNAMFRLRQKEEPFYLTRTGKKIYSRKWKSPHYNEQEKSTVYKPKSKEDEYGLLDS